MKKKLSVVVPVYNEEENIRFLYPQLVDVAARLAEYEFEFIFMDNRSTDRSWSVMRELAAEDSRVKAVRLARNFGYQRSIYTGYALASGDAAVQVDCDMQDPPGLIPDFVAKWQEGYEVVYGVRRGRREGLMITATRKMFYRLVNRLSADDLPIDAGDFRLVDRKVLNELKRLYDCNPYLRGTIAAMGFNQIGIVYDRSARARGDSKFSLGSLFGLALDAILNHSIVPLRIASVTGMVVACLTLLALVIFVATRVIFGREWPPGFATTTVLILASISLNALFLGIIGEYLGRIYQQVKQRPVAVIDTMVGFEQTGAAAVLEGSLAGRESK